MDPSQTPRVFCERYELNHLIARGGMAQVYRAHDRCSTVRSPSRSSFPNSPSTGRSSSGSAARPRQPPTSPIPTSCPSSTGARTPGTYFIVMEFIDGRPLSAILQVGRAPLGGADRRYRRPRGSGPRATPTGTASSTATSSPATS